MSKYQRRHYVDLAQLIFELRTEGQSQLFAPEEVDRFARALAQLFARDNPRFDRARFLFACGLPEDR